MLKQVNGFDLVSLFWFQMPFMMLPKDTAAIEKSGQKLLSVAGLSFLLGLFANVQIKRINMNFLKLPIYVKFPIRMAVMALPFAAFSSVIAEKGNEILTIVDKINMKKNQLVRTKDL